MKKKITLLTCLLGGLLVCGISTRAQTTTINTTGAPGFFTVNNGYGIVTFNFQNTNNCPVIITGFSASAYNGSGSQTAYLYYQTSPLTGGTPPPVTSSPWILGGSATINPPNSNMMTFLSGLNVSIPAGATYAIAVGSIGSSDAMGYYSLPNGATTYTFSAGGCNLIANGTVGYANASLTLGGPFSFNPRGFVGSITFQGGVCCTFIDDTTHVTLCSNQSYTVGSHTYTTSGHYIDTFTRTCGSADSVVHTYLTVNPVPNVTVSTNGKPTTFCMGDSIVLQASSNISGVYKWKNDATLVGLGVGTGSSYTATTSGSYTFSVTVNGCIGTSAPVAITVNPRPAITTSRSPILCTGDSIMLISSLSAGNIWSTGATTAAITVASSGSYSVATQYCSGDTVAIIVNPYPTVVAIPTGPIPFCAGEAVVLKAQAQPAVGVTYQWRKNGIDILGGVNTTRLVNTSGNYTVKATLGNCPGESLPISINILPLPEPIITAVEPVLSTDNIYTSYSWLWYNQSIVNANNYTYTALQNGDYTVLVSDMYGCMGVSDAYTITSLNIGSVLVDAVKVYPNPTQDVVHIEAPVKVNIVLVSTEGKTVLQQNNASVIDVTAIASGIYMLRITDSQGQLIKVERLVKNMR
jgi:hypothetical protein